MAYKKVLDHKYVIVLLHGPELYLARKDELLHVVPPVLGACIPALFLNAEESPVQQ